MSRNLSYIFSASCLLPAARRDIKATWKLRKPSKTGRKRRRGRPPASLALIEAHVRQLQEHDPRKLESIVQDVRRARKVGRATVYKALKKATDLQKLVASICDEALPRLQASEDTAAKAKAAYDAAQSRHRDLWQELKAAVGSEALDAIETALPRLQASEDTVAKAKAAYDAAQNRHRDLWQELKAAVGSEALDAIETMRKLNDNKKAVKLWREWELTIRLLKYLGSPLGTEFEELLQLSGLELRQPAVQAAPTARPRYIVAMLQPSAFQAAPAALSALGFAPLRLDNPPAAQAVPTLTEEGHRVLGL